MIREELSRPFTVGERHRRNVCCRRSRRRSWCSWWGQCSCGRSRTVTKAVTFTGFGDAAFFVAVQLLTVSSQIKNPVTSGGKVVDVVLEIWAIFVVTAVAGSFATFFGSGDSSS